MGGLGLFIFLMISKAFYTRWTSEIPTLVTAISNFMTASIISVAEIALFSKQGISLVNSLSLIGVLIAAIIIGRIFVTLNRDPGAEIRNDTDYPDMREKNSNSNMLAVTIVFGFLLTFIQLLLWRSI